MQFNIKVTIIVVGVDLESGSYHILSEYTDDGSITCPHLYLTQEMANTISEHIDITDIVKSELEKYLTLDMLFVNPKCIYSNLVSGDTLEITYASMIPLDSTLLNRASFVTAQQASPTILKALSQHEFI